MGRRGAGRPDGDASGAAVAPRAEPVNGRELRLRLDEPIARVTELTRRTMQIFPVRVWRHFLQRNGFLLSAGMSYQALFATFAAIYVAFAIAGLWLVSSPGTLDALITLINTYAPGLIGPKGLITTDDLVDVTEASTSLFGLTGAVALAGLIWTAISWITYTRLAVRSTFGLPRDDRPYVLLKARDFLAALGFGIALVVAALLSIVATTLLDAFLDLLGLSAEAASPVMSGGLRFGSLVVVFVIDTVALAVLFRFLSGAAVPWRRMWIGSLLGSAALSVLHVLGGFLVTATTNNPLLATFTVFIGLLLWFRIASIVILVAAAWIAIETADANDTLRPVTPDQRAAEALLAERRADAAERRREVRTIRDAMEEAGWFGWLRGRRRLTRAEADLADAELAVADAERALDQAAAEAAAARRRRGRRRNRDVGGLA
ncbi:YihY/virulence factor BrkB family protein [Agromyces sp. NDB4Y10]|uniref:YihY/virulence factor BrkB family protein n=1 Tax=Agromyces sp. NDB4Y10 TaxID=1775951 RepID=UPI000AA298DA|nr:YihY/virulence factor BrkB family protein [Agromyces sp. NDB4Y10]